MRYRTKVLLLFVFLALVSNSLLFTLLYLQAKHSLVEQMQTTVLSIGSTVTAALNTEQLQRIKDRNDEGSPDYKELEAFLRKLRNANRRPDIHVRFIYTIAPNRDNSKDAHYLVDAEEDGKDKSHVGENYKSEGEVLDFENAQAPAEFVKDQYGTWFSAMVPIRDLTGKSFAILGVDIDAKDVVAQTRRLLFSGLGITGISLLLAVGFAMWVSRRVAQPLAKVRQAVHLIGQGKLETQIDWKSRDEFGDVAMAINEMVLGLRQRDNLKSTLVSYVSQHVADEIMATGNIAKLSSERRKVTVLFADVRGFTALSENMSPEEIVGFLNEYFDKMIEAIFRHRGTLNKFMGDGLMAMFGAPVDDAYQEEHAIRAALDMQDAMHGLRDRIGKGGETEFRIGIGINTGVAVVGNIGSRQKMEYTAIGDTVNTASRLESKTKEMGADILVSEYTYVAVRSLFKFKKESRIQLKGKADSIQVYSVDSMASPPTP